MTTLTKIKWILGVSLIFLLILATNLIDRQNFITIRDSVGTIYTDRLWAKNIIYDITKQLGEKEVAYVKFESGQQPRDLSVNNQLIGEQIDLFALTKLTAMEESTFSLLKKDLQKLEETEKAAFSGKVATDRLFAELTLVRKHLDQLVKIQMQEGRRELFISNKAIGSIELFTQIEIIGLVIMAVIIQIMILYTPRKEAEV